MKRNAVKQFYDQFTWDPVQKEMVLRIGATQSCAVKAESLLDWRKLSLQPPRLQSKLVD